MALASSLDWGQDSWRLEAWIDRHTRSAEPQYVTYALIASVDAELAREEYLSLPRTQVTACQSLGDKARAGAAARPRDRAQAWLRDAGAER